MIPWAEFIKIGVALRLSDGRVFGTFCCFSFKANPKLDEHGLDLLRAFADLIVYQIETDSDHFRIHAEKKARIQAALESGQPSIVYQPVFRLSDSAVVGAEALSRFGIGPQRSPDIWFSEAGDVGLKTELELTAVNSALSKYRSLWKRGPMYLGLNSSPQTISSGGVLNAIEGFPADRIILEITEHDFVENYDDLLRALVPLRMRGVKIAVDDAGSGYASMRHILNVHPDYIKLDISLTHDIDRDGTRRALARSLIEFGRETQCKIVAEGVETEAEMAVLRELGVYAAQGYLLARPISIEELWRLVL
jgi:EAL domain-containing protein (putative c-di-GMP-specific phosphodiesterase class I)